MEGKGKVLLLVSKIIHMDATFLLEVSAIVAVVFELVKRGIALKVTNPVVQDYLFRGLLIAMLL